MQVDPGSTTSLQHTRLDVFVCVDVCVWECMCVGGRGYPKAQTQQPYWGVWESSIGA